MKKNNKKKDTKSTDKLPSMINDLLAKADRDVPDFYLDGECEVFYVPIEDGELRLFHHKPGKLETKRPILFVPGFGTTPWSWRHFHRNHHGFAEYYHLETREKKSSRVGNRFKAKMTIDQTARDVGEVIKFLGLDKRDFLLIGASYSGGVLLHGLAKRYFTPPTTVAFDPLIEWIYHRSLIYILRFIPSLLVNIIKFFIAKIVVSRMQNLAQKKRIMNLVDGAEIWKWKKCTYQNRNFDIHDELSLIRDKVFIFHGPKDRYHPDDMYMDITKRIPGGQYFYMSTDDKNREMLLGVIGTAFSKVNRKEGTPPLLKPFEITLNADNPKG